MIGGDIRKIKPNFWPNLILGKAEVQLGFNSTPCLSGNAERSSD